ncbi:MAG: PAS domain S-box protein [Balneola sp.]
MNNLDSRDKLKLFESVFENSGIAIALVHASGELFRVNNFFCEWLGYSKEEMLSMTFAEFTHPEDVDADLELYKELIDGTRDYYRLEKRYITKGSEIVWADLSVSLIRDDQNVPQYGIGMVKDITPSKNKEKELTVKTEELQDAIDTLKEIQEVSRIGTWEVDLITLEISWSDEVYNIHEVEIGTPLKVEDGINFYREDYREEIQSVIDAAIEKNESWDVECVLVTGKGKEIWVRAIGYPVFEGEKLTALRGLFMDIDESKRKSQSLDEANEKLQLSVEAGQIAIWIWNLKTNELEWNDKAYEVFGVEENVEPNFEMFSQMIHPSDLEIVTEATTKTLETGERFDIVFRFNKPDGTEVILSGRGDLIRDSKGSPAQMIGINLDITERMRLLESIRLKESQLRSFVEQAPAAVAMLDTEMKYITVSNQWFKQYNLDKKDLIGISHYDVFPEIKEMPEWLEQHQKVLNGEELSNPKDKIVRMDGTVQWISWKLIPWFNEPGEIGGMIMYTADITSEVSYTDKLEKEVAKRTKELASVNDELESFSYSVSHDLRAPLRAINGFSDILIEDYEDKIDENGIRLLKIVKNSAVKMGKLIDDILQFSRLGKTSIKFGTLNMEMIFNSAVSDLNAEYADKKIEVEISPLHTASGDTSLINQVIVNLMSNAYKYSANEDKISVIVKSEVQDKYIKYSIKDNGVGFDMKYHEKLFGVFQRLHTDSEFEGTGVGLAIVRRIIGKHGGSIWAESKIGEGSTFYFTVPKETPIK